MTVRLGLSMLAAVLALGAAGCGGSSPAAPATLIEPIHIESVDVLLMESFPVQGVAHVTGFVGDGCSEALPPRTVREGTLITITIERTRPVDAICTQIAKLYDEQLALGTLSPGDYVLRVNDVERTFHVD